MTAGSTTGCAPVVLVGFAEAFAAVEVAWSLQTSGLRVVAFARQGSRTALRHVRGVKVVDVPSPESGIEATLKAVDRLLRIQPIDAFMPLDDSALWVSQRIEMGNCVLVGPDGDGARLALDKAAQLEVARHVGFSVPPTVHFAGADDVRELAFPAVLKPSDAVRVDDSGHLVRPSGGVCADQGELERLRDKLGNGPVLAQPLIIGRGEGVFGYASGGSASVLSAHRRLRMANPQGSASSACASAPVDVHLSSAAHQFLRACRWSGLFMFEFLRDLRGTPWFMELNGRAWGSMALARRRGLEYPAWAVQDALGLSRDPTPPDQPIDVVARHAGRELAHLAFVVRGPQSSAITEWPSRRQAVRDVLRVRRGQRFYNWDGKQSSIFFYDTWCTMRDLVSKARR